MVSFKSASNDLFSLGTAFAFTEAMKRISLFLSTILFTACGGDEGSAIKKGNNSILQQTAPKATNGTSANSNAITGAPDFLRESDQLISPTALTTLTIPTDGIDKCVAGQVSWEIIKGDGFEINEDENGCKIDVKPVGTVSGEGTIVAKYKNKDNKIVEKHFRFKVKSAPKIEMEKILQVSDTENGWSALLVKESGQSGKDIFYKEGNLPHAYMYISKTKDGHFIFTHGKAQVCARNGDCTVYEDRVHNRRFVVDLNPIVIDPDGKKQELTIEPTCELRGGNSGKISGCPFEFEKINAANPKLAFKFKTAATPLEDKGYKYITLPANLFLANFQAEEVSIGIKVTHKGLLPNSPVINQIGLFPIKLLR